MDTITRTLDRNIKKLTIEVLGDFHIGDSFTNLKEIQEVINKIKNDKNRYCILNGDLINNAITTSVSNTYEDTMPPERQIDYLTNLLMPIKDKILVLTSGNHENRTKRATDIAPLRELAYKLGLTYYDEKEKKEVSRFLPDGGVLFLRLGEIKGKKATNKNKLRQVCYTMFVQHGYGGGRKAGSKINKVVDLKEIIDTDIYIHSHTHQPAVVPGLSLRIDTRNNKVNEFEKLYLNTGSFLNYGGYGQRAAYTPLSRRSPKLVLNGTKKEFDAYTLDMDFK